MYTQKVTAKSLILDVLRASDPTPLPVFLLVGVAQVFDISENAVRVNLSRLVAKGILEQDERGYYRCSQASSPIRQWANRWWLGEQRVTEWRGDYWLLQPDADLNAAQRRSIGRACYRMGFREAWPERWLRPDNLSAEPEQLIADLAALAEDQRFLLTKVSEFHGHQANWDARSLWSVDDLHAEYQQLIQALEASLEAVPRYSLEEVFKESYLLGGDAIHCLAIDPLLPQEYCDVTLRQALTALMKRYDDVCRPYWRELFVQIKFHSLPRHLEPRLQANSDVIG